MENPSVLFDRVGLQRTSKEYADGDPIFSQGSPCDAIYFLEKGRVKISVVSDRGKEAIITVLDAPAFFGEGCLTGQELRIASAKAITAVVETSLPFSWGVGSADRQIRRL